MRVHHLSCGTFAPPLMPPVVCHVLLCEAGDGLVLVDTGLGLHDYAEPKRRMGPTRHLLRPVSDGSSTALRQIEALGHTAADVTHIVLTHLDFDHIGGLSDFPHATVHTTADEHAAAITSPDFLDKRRYRPAQWSHGPQWQLHGGRGDVWREGLTAHEVLPGITLVPMPGHSRGHAAVAVVSTGSTGGSATGGSATGELLVHAGDAVFDAASYADASPSGRPLAKIGPLRAFEQIVGRDRAAIRRNHATLRALNDTDGVTVLPAHDQRILDDLMGQVAGG
ncbi:MBL fold metallo-hydrolase [Aeromicrobium wangtongii]|uniref:MBL fold metallo-hydrolase n=1 Tax=Aeromicrobium wangtongii TaxID=2969247 RepID=A0ABY5M9X7_9ACTN|nr:MBL fold metallo-hydrolase [Aeromicrobium wangtongii]MCD9199495.1 MBL fold metallo-hydrolase [Aeromicrobium wangtongii]UUP13848.1 MBL fold metallo-hydrolase [Aeromicrobium wangtongii]